MNIAQNCGIIASIYCGLKEGIELLIEEKRSWVRFNGNYRPKKFRLGGRHNKFWEIETSMAEEIEEVKLKMTKWLLNFLIVEKSINIFGKITKGKIFLFQNVLSYWFLKIANWIFICFVCFYMSCLVFLPPFVYFALFTFKISVSLFSESLIMRNSW